MKFDINEVSNILKEEIKQYKSKLDCCPVVATVSEPLSDERIRNLSHRIASAVRRNIELKVVVDPSIIGGVIIRYGENVVDNSVRRRLAETVKTVKNYCRERGRIDEV